MSNIRCQSVSALLDPYVNRDLSEESIAIVERHLMTCVECAFEVRTLEQTVNHLKSALIGSDENLPAFRERMCAKLEQAFEDILTPKVENSEFQRTLPLY